MSIVAQIRGEMTFSGASGGQPSGGQISPAAGTEFRKYLPSGETGNPAKLAEAVPATGPGSGPTAVPAEHGPAKETPSCRAP